MRETPRSAAAMCVTRNLAPLQQFSFFDSRLAMGQKSKVETNRGSSIRLQRDATLDPSKPWISGVSPLAVAGGNHDLGCATSYRVVWPRQKATTLLGFVVALFSCSALSDL